MSRAAYMRAYTAKNREKIAAQRRARYRLRADAVRERERARNARMNGAERKAKRQREAAWEAANPDRVAASKARDRRLHQAARRSAKANAQAKRRARLRGADVEPVDRRDVFERDGGICGICHLPADPGDWHLDHVLPLALGGEHSYVNVQVSHPVCNMRKGQEAIAA